MGSWQEGSVWEAAAFAAHAGAVESHRDGRHQRPGQSGPTMYRHDMEVYRAKFEAQGWHTEVIDGHDAAAVIAALDRARTIPNRPQAIIARTDKGHGVSFLSGKEGWRGKPLNQEQMEKALAELKPVPPVIPDDGRSYARTSLPEPPDFPARKLQAISPARRWRRAKRMAWRSRSSRL